jgi:DNA-binding transcriptional ArsR family regulator
MVIKFRLSAEDLSRTTFSYSPLLEVCSSLRMLSAHAMPPDYRFWFEEVRTRLKGLDWIALSAVAPFRHEMPTFFEWGLQGTDTRIERQLRLIADLPADELRRELGRTWAEEEEIPPDTRKIIEDGRAGPARIAAALWEYWVLAIEPYWPQLEAVLADDLTVRLKTTVTAGLGCTLASLDSRIQLVGGSLLVHKPHAATHEVGGAGLDLIPSVFVWRSLGVAVYGKRPVLHYGARRLQLAWNIDRKSDLGALSALLGRTRAEVLASLQFPRPTAAVAHELGLSRPAANQHLTLLLRSGLVTTRRTGRYVLYQRTELGDRLVLAIED